MFAKANCLIAITTDSIRVVAEHTKPLFNANIQCIYLAQKHNFPSEDALNKVMLYQDIYCQAYEKETVVF